MAGRRDTPYNTDRENRALAKRLAAVARIAGINVDFDYDPADGDPVTRMIDAIEAAEAREHGPILRFGAGGCAFIPRAARPHPRPLPLRLGEGVKIRNPRLFSELKGSSPASAGSISRSPY